MDYNNDKLTELKSRLDTLNGYWRQQYSQVEADLRFASGYQWTSEEIKRRQKRPTLVVNQIGTYARRIVNTVKMNPFSISVQSDNPKASEFIENAIRAIEYDTDAQSAYATALEHSTICGLGWLIVRNDYINDDSVEQTIKIESPRDPRMVLIDPNANSVQNARYGVYYSFIDKDVAVETYGDEVDGAYNSLVYESFNVPGDTVADVYYYCLKTKEQVKYWLIDGSQTFEKPMTEEFIANSRKVVRKYVEITHFVGCKEIDSTTMDIPFLPIVPVFGNVVYDDSIRYAGIVKDMRDVQIALNYIASTETELIASAPKNPWVIADAQLTGHSKEWSRAASDPPTFLSYKYVQGAPTPARENNVAQTQSLQQAYSLRQSDMQKVTGIFDTMLGTGGTDESGVALGIKNMNGDIATAGYIDGLQNAIVQVGRIILKMLPIVYDTDRIVKLLPADGEMEFVEANIAQIMEEIRDLNVYCTAGPAYQTRKALGMSSLMTMATLLPEDKKTSFLDIMVDNADIPNKSKVLSRLKRIMPADLMDENAMDPQAAAALQTAEATIAEQQATIQQVTEQANAVITNLQQYIIAKENEIQSKMQQTVITEENKYRIELLKQEGANSRKLAEIEAKLQEFMEKAELQSAEKLLDISQQNMDRNLQAQKQATDTALEATKIITGKMPAGTAPQTIEVEV